MAVLFPATSRARPGTLPLAEVIAIAHAKGIPVLVDAAGRVYPLDKFRSYARDGADLVAFGAKYLGALNASGILCGRKDLVDAAAMHGFMGFETVSLGKSFGRPLKLDRQTIVAVVTALQEWLETDHAARLASYERRLKAMAAEIDGAPGVTMSMVEGDGPAPRVMRLSLRPGARPPRRRGRRQGLVEWRTGHCRRPRRRSGDPDQPGHDSRRGRRHRRLRLGELLL